MLARKGARTSDNQSEEVSNLFASRCGGGGTSDIMGLNNQPLKGCPTCKKCYASYILSTVRPPEGGATVDDSGASEPTPENIRCKP